MGGSYKNILDSIDCSIFLAGREGDILYANDESVQKLGYEEEELCSMSLSEVHTSEFRDEIERKINQLEVDETIVFESSHVTHDGDEIPVEVSLSLTTFEGGSVVLAVARDITERKKKEEELRKSEQEKSLILNTMNELVFLQDLDGRIIWCNEAVVENLDVESREEILGNFCYEVSHGISEKCDNCPTREVIEDEEFYQGEVVTPDGRVWLVNHSPIFDSDGNLENILAVEEDITDLREAEKRERFLHNLLRQDLKSKQQLLMGNLQLIKDNFNGTIEDESFLDKAFNISKSCEELLRMVESLRKMEKSRWEGGKNLFVVLEEALYEASDLFEENDIDINRSFSEDIECVVDYSLKDLIFQILKIRIERGEAKRIEISVDDDGNKVLLKVVDDGVSLPEDIKRLFDGRVYTGSTMGAGGAKYYTVKRMSDINNIGIELEDSDFGGVEFKIWLGND